MKFCNRHCMGSVSLSRRRPSGSFAGRNARSHWYENLDLRCDELRTGVDGAATEFGDTGGDCACRFQLDDRGQSEFGAAWGYEVRIALWFVLGAALFRYCPVKVEEDRFEPVVGATPDPVRESSSLEQREEKCSRLGFAVRALLPG